MSTAQIIEELPKLSHDDRVEIASRIREIEEAEDLEIAEALALQAFQMMDQLEAEHEAANPSR